MTPERLSDRNLPEIAKPSAVPVLRFAPSPNGDLHLGHAVSALFGFHMAMRLGGRFLVRIEDLDATRCRDSYIAGIFEDLAWLGISWETPVLRQSESLPVYEAAAARLRAMGLLYPCFATRSEIAAALGGSAQGESRAALDPDGTPLYPGVHRNLPTHEIARRREGGEPFAERLDMAKAVALAKTLPGGATLEFDELGEERGPHRFIANPAVWGDVVLVRKEAPASYHLAVVVDDARQGVTDVTRGLDLFAATDLHRLLQVLLGLPAPRYHHHRLILDPTGRKLSKSARDTSLRSLRAQGMTAAEVKAMVGFDDAPACTSS